MKNNQSGRTMLEMLCVLAIMAVLTLGGLRGYRYMITRYRANKISEAIAFIATQIRASYTIQEDYSGIDNQTALDIGAIPEQIVRYRESSQENGKNSLETPWGGFINIFPSTLDKETAGQIIYDDEGHSIPLGDSFVVEIGNITRTTCTLLITNDWGNTVNSGFVGIAASSNTCSNLANSGTPMTYAGGCSSGYGLQNIYLREDGVYTKGKYEALSSEQPHKAKYAYGIPGSKKWSIPVAPVLAAKGCDCTDEDGNEVALCSFAIKFY